MCEQVAFEDASANRKHVFSVLTGLIEGVVSGRLAKHNGVCRLILGPKGVGKSTLSIRLAEYTRQHHQDTAVFYNYSIPTEDDGTLILPSEMFGAARATLGDLSPAGSKLADGGIASQIAAIHLRCDSIRRQEEELKRCKQRLVLFIDELDHIFKYKTTRARRFLSELEIIGGLNDERCTLCFVSGSSARTRALCFGKYPLDERTFPSYSGSNMNSSKYSVIHLDPVTDCFEFPMLLDAICKDPDFNRGNGEKLNVDMFSSEVKALLLLLSGGNARILSTFILEDLRRRLRVDMEEASTKATSTTMLATCPDIAAIEQRRLDNRLLSTLQEVGRDRAFAYSQFKYLNPSAMAILRSLYTSLDIGNRLPKRRSADQFISAITRIHLQDIMLSIDKLPVDIVDIEGNLAGSIQLHELYELADEGLIFLQEQSAYPFPRIGFVNHLQILAVFHCIHADALSPMDTFCLIHPYSQNGIRADDIVLRSVACSLNTDIAFGSPISPIHPENDIGMYSQSIRTMFKEQPDSYGADGLWVETPTRWRRIQVKLGASPLGTRETESIASNLSSGSLRVWAAHGKWASLKVQMKCKKVNDPLSIVSVLLTTRPISKGARAVLDAHQIELWDRKEMCRRWVAPIQTVAREFCLSEYGVQQDDGESEEEGTESSAEEEDFN